MHLVNLSTLTVTHTVQYTSMGEIKEQGLPPEQVPAHVLCDQVGLGGAVTFCVLGHYRGLTKRLYWVFASAFTPSLSVCCWTADGVNKTKEKQLLGEFGSAGDNSNDANDLDEDEFWAEFEEVYGEDGGPGALSMFQVNNLQDASPLVNFEFQKNKSLNGSCGSRTVATNKTKVKPKKCLQNKPLVFHSKIKSSGYGSVAPRRRMFSPQLSKQKGAEKGNNKAKKRLGVYPKDCGMLNVLQEKNKCLEPLHSGN